MILRVKHPGQSQLFGITHAQDALCFGLGLSQRGQEHPRKNRDDRNDHQQFDESESSAVQWFALMHRGASIVNLIHLVGNLRMKLNW